MIVPAAADALRDRRLQRRDLIVYGYALQSLSFYAPRTFKVRQVARVVQMSPPEVSRATRRLVNFGYLERGPDDGAIHTYLVRGIVDSHAA